MSILRDKYREQIDELVGCCRRMSDLGYVASHGGSASYRLDRDLILVTPTRLAKRKLCADDIVLINAKGEITDSLNGRRPRGETSMHLRILERRPDIWRVLHAHPPVLTGFAISSTNILSKSFLQIVRNVPGRGRVKHKI